MMMITAENFWDRTAKGYAENPIKNMDAYNLTMDRTRHYLSTDKHALEIGCGSGSTAMLLASHVKHITASDISAKMIEIGKKQAQESGIKNIDFVKATPLDTVLGNNTYDAVLAYNILHLLEDLPAALSRINRLIKPGGLFISKTPCLGQKKGYLRIPIFFMQLVKKAPYVNFLKIKEIEKAIENAGFEIIETGNYPETFPSRFIVARKKNLH